MAHERATAERLAAHGFEVEFLPVDRHEGAKNPDALLNGEAWEFKSPTGTSERNTISGQFASARGQSPRLVIDLARCGLPDDVAVPQIRRRFAGQERFRRVLVLEHDGSLVVLTHR